MAGNDSAAGAKGDSKTRGRLLRDWPENAMDWGKWKEEREAIALQ